MGITHGVAGVHGATLKPEVRGIFLCLNDFEVKWFADMAISAGHESVDVWEVALPAEVSLVESDDGSGYEYFPEPIPRDAIRLVRSDWSPEPQF